MKIKAFTLVELLVTISIISILSTLWFIAYNNYVVDSRDTNRVSQVQNIWDWLEFALAREQEISIIDPLFITIDWEEYSRQWEINDSILKKIKFSWSWEDPSTKEPYILNLATNNKDYDILSFLESPSNAPNQTNKDDFVLTDESKLAYVYWKNNIWVFTDNNYIPLNKTNSGTINIDCSSDQWYKLIFKSGLELSPIVNQSIDPNWPCYNDIWNYCWDRPDIDNAIFHEGTPSEANQDWIKADNTNSCSYQCDNWYTWLFCENPPAWAWMDTNYSDIKSLLVWECGISETDFDNNFDSSTWIYTWNINCSWVWIQDDDFQLFDTFVVIDGNFIMDDNNITNLNPLWSLERVSWKMSFNNNMLDNISILWVRSSNDFSNIELAWNNLTNIEWLRNLNSIRYLDVDSNNINDISSISSLNNLLSLKLSDNNISDISAIWGRNTLRILDLSYNNISNINSLYWINNLEYIDVSNNNISSIYPLRDSNNLNYINISWNDSIDNLSYFTTNSTINWIFQTNTRNYSTKIHNSANICNNWTIRDHNWNNYPNTDHICN